jgi:hypothetical protein
LKLLQMRLDLLELLYELQYLQGSVLDLLLDLNQVLLDLLGLLVAFLDMLDELPDLLDLLVKLHNHGMENRDVRLGEG